MKTNQIKYFYKIKKMQVQAWLLDKYADLKWWILEKIK